MHNPRLWNKSDVMLGFVAASVVLMSGAVMSKLSATYPNFAAMISPTYVYGQSTEVVSQSAVAPDARADLPAIAAACPVSLELLDEGNAIIGGTLLAPCLPSQDLVIAHAGLVFSAKTLASGALFFSLPALQTEAKIDIRFIGGDTASAAIEMPDVALVQRAAVQWPPGDGFAIHAFENGAAFGGAGHIWQNVPNTPAPGMPPNSGYLTSLGDASVQMPLMAQVYTYDNGAKTDVLFEAVVTETNCAAELMGDVIFSGAGTVTQSEITVAMPDCNALGEFVHIGYTPPSLDLALVN